MKKATIIYLSVLFIIVVTACKPSINENREKIAKFEKEILAPNVAFDSVKVKQLIGLYIDFADKFPNDTNAGKYLFSASGLAVNISKYQQSINLLDRIIANYPKVKYIPDCIFLKAFIYDDKLKDFKNASKFYNEVIEKYPDNDLAPAAKASMQTLGVPAEVLIKAFEQQKTLKVDTIRS